MNGWYWAALIVAIAAALGFGYGLWVVYRELKKGLR